MGRYWDQRQACNSQAQTRRLSRALIPAILLQEMLLREMLLRATLLPARLLQEMPLRAIPRIRRRARVHREPRPRNPIPIPASTDRRWAAGQFSVSPAQAKRKAFAYSTKRTITTTGSLSICRRATGEACSPDRCRLMVPRGTWAITRDNRRSRCRERRRTPTNRKAFRHSPRKTQIGYRCHLNSSATLPATLRATEKPRIESGA